MITYYVLDTEGTCYYSTYRKAGKYLEVYQDDRMGGVFVETNHTNIEELIKDSRGNFFGGTCLGITFEGTEKEYNKYLMAMELLK